MSDTKELTYSDVSEHTSKKDLYVVIHDKIYNASSFVDEHPYVSVLLCGGCLLGLLGWQFHMVEQRLGTMLTTNGTTEVEKKSS